MPPGILVYQCIARNCLNGYFIPITEKNYVNKKFFRFPDVDIERRRKWFEIMNLTYSNKRCYLCEFHFHEKDFTDSNKNRLTKFALPFKITPKINILQNIQIVPPKIPLSIAEPNIELNFRLPNTSNIDDHSTIGCSSKFLIKKRPLELSSNVSPISKKRKQHFTLSSINERRIKNLTPRKQKMYVFNKKQKNVISKLKKKISLSKQKVKVAYELSKTSLFRDLENNVDPAVVSFFESSFKNVKRKRPSWQPSDKVYALALYKRGPRCYNFLRRSLPLPSKSTLRKILRNVPFDAGINPTMMLKLSKRIKNMDPLDRNCSLIFDEISLSEQMTLDTSSDKVTGYVDLGPLGRHNHYANHALCFMVNGLHKSWKQPVAYFFTKDTIKTGDLKFLIKYLIIELEKTGLTILSTICDQGSTNRSAIKQLCQENSRPGSYFLVNNHKVYTIFDPPHLLKNTRTALFNYTIRYLKNKEAKFQHIKQCFFIDKLKRFQSLRKIRESYLLLKNGNNRLKMKVSVAARTLSQTVAATIEEMIGNPQNNLPSDAIHTAEFIHDIDNLFDSFNGSKPKSELGKTYRTCISKKSPHKLLWNTLLPKINSWEFISEQGIKTQMPFKSGWITSINATKQLWEECERLGFRFLRTRSLNQDPLENFFASIRHFGAENTNPNPYQFISAFKTSVLNNLVSHSLNRNCEQDEGGLLYDLQDFLEDNTNMFIPLQCLEDNELDSLPHPNIQIDLDKDQHDSNSATYVAGFLVKKIKLIKTCEKCADNLISNIREPQHTFTMFKEYTDTKERLTYVTKDVTYVLLVIHDIIINLILPKFGYILNLTQKVKLFLIKHVSFDWFTCLEHLDEIKNEILNVSIRLIIKKYYDDVFRNFQRKSQKSKCDIKKLKKMQHLS